MKCKIYFFSKGWLIFSFFLNNVKFSFIFCLCSKQNPYKIIIHFNFPPTNSSCQDSTYYLWIHLILETINKHNNYL